MLELNHITKTFGDGPNRVTAVRDVSLRLGSGAFVAVMGPSGSGKSTLLNVTGGLDRPSSGEVILDGTRLDTLDENALVAVRRGRLAYVFQQYHLIPSLTALENVLLPLVFGGSNGRQDEALDILRRVGLESRVHHRPSQLSGGEQQRVAIARALVNHPSFILADEPTGNMDQETGREILGLFRDLNREGHSILMVTHDPDIARQAKEIIVLRDGQITKRTRTGREGEDHVEQEETEP